MLFENLVEGMDIFENEVRFEKRTSSRWEIIYSALKVVKYSKSFLCWNIQIFDIFEINIFWLDYYLRFVMEVNETFENEVRFEKIIRSRWKIICPTYKWIRFSKSFLWWNIQIFNSFWIKYFLIRILFEIIGWRKLDFWKWSQIWKEDKTYMQTHISIFEID
jgi:hypothetical protein